jgi:hypothetical protein
MRKLSSLFFAGAFLMGHVLQVEAMGILPPPPPTITFSVGSPTTIATGQSTALFWKTLNATSVSIDPDYGNASLNGSLVVSPKVTTTYTLTATGTGGKTTATATVTVVPPTASCQNAQFNVVNQSSGIIHVEIYGSFIGNVYETSVAAGQSRLLSASAQPNPPSGNYDVAYIAFVPGSNHNVVNCASKLSVVNGCPRQGVNATLWVSSAPGFPTIQCSVTVLDY